MKFIVIGRNDGLNAKRFLIKIPASMKKEDIDRFLQIIDDEIELTVKKANGDIEYFYGSGKA